MIRYATHALRTVTLLTVVGIGPVAFAAAASNAVDTPLDELETSIRLRSRVQLAPSVTEVRLRDIARLDTDIADRLGGIVVAVLPDDATATVIAPGDVRAALAEAGVHPGRVLVTGGQVRIRPGGVRIESRAPVAMSAVRLTDGRAVVGPAETVPTDEPTHGSLVMLSAKETLGGDDLMASVTHRLLTALNRAPADVQIGVERSTAALLARPAETHRVRFLDRFDAPAIRIRIEARDAAGAVDPTEPMQLVVVRPRLRSTTITLRQPLRRDDHLTAAMVDVVDAWVTPRAAAGALAIDAISGQTAARGLSAGHVLGRADLQPPIVVRRGDAIRLVVGVTGYEMRSEVIARRDGRPGDTIPVHREGEDASFKVVITGPGVARPAAASLDDPPAAAPRVAGRDRTSPAPRRRSTTR